jgi:polar amino acid transport system substrate-binding protein
MFKARLDKKVNTVVFSSPVLLYYASHEGKGLVELVGLEFNTAPIAFTVQLNSPLRRQIDIALLKLREIRTYQQIYAKWFGAPQ